MSHLFRHIVIASEATQSVVPLARGYPVKAEITFDFVMTEDMPFVEGCYRMDDGDWQVFMFRHSRRGAEPVG